VKAADEQTETTEELTPEEQAAKDAAAATAVKVAPTVKPVAKPAPAQAPVAAKKVAAKAPVKAQENGGFEGALAPTGEPNLGDQDFGYVVPPELESAVEEGKDAVDESYSPGILIPPGLEDAVMAVADPADLPKDEEARFDLIPFVPEEATTVAEVLNAGAHWVLFANGEPMAKITLKDQDHYDRIAAHFVSPDFAKSIIDGIQKHGLGETLKAVKAKPYVAKVDTNKKIVEIKAKLEASSNEAIKQKVAAIKAKFVENLGLVLEASANNFIVENPLKDALIADMTGVGIPEQVASEMVDNAFFSQGNKSLASILDKAEEWSNLTPEALKEIKSAMQSAGRRSRALPSNLGAAHANPNYDQALANKMAAAAVPVAPGPQSETLSASTRIGAPTPVDNEKKAAFRSKFGKFSTY
jgi:uncharacterized protein Veg